VTQLQSELLNKDREIEESEEKHLAEIKVYKQKVKHLLYEYQNNLTRIQTDAEKTLDHSQEENNQVVDGLKKQIRTLKLELKELELSHQEVIKNIKLKHDQDVIKLRSDFDLRCKELYAKYAYNTKALREDMELRRKNEIHELEERKNSQINALMKNHEKAFAEIKNYYNDITLNNLALINSLKEQVEGMKKKEERTERLMNEINAENKTLKKPLDDAKTETEELKRKLKNYEKDQMALKNTKSRLKVYHYCWISGFNR
jgi:chromosome segregation ATPase